MKVSKYISWFLFCLIQIVVTSHPANAQTGIDPNGYNVFYYPNGNKSSEGTMRDGKPDGYWKTYSDNGNLKTEGNRKNFLLDSLWKFYSTSGIIQSEITYSEGKKNGVSRIYNEKGVLLSEENYVNNIKQGTLKTFHANGKVKRVESYVNNELEGEVKEFDTSGVVIGIEAYKNGFISMQQNINRFDSEGKKSGKWVEFYPDGSIKSEAEFTGGIQIGYFKEYDKKGNLKVIEKFEEGIKQEEAEELIFIDIRTVYHPNSVPKLVGGYTDNLKNGVFREYDTTGKLINSYIYENDTIVAEGIVEESGFYSGNWKYFYKSGQLKAEGRYENGVKIDEWKYYHRNGKIEQKGKYAKGKPHGLWKWSHPNGQPHREETYRYGKEDGITTEYDSLGVLLTKGEYIDGIRNGEWFYHVGDHTEKGNFKDGERDGEWVYTYQNGKTAFIGKYENGLAEGKHKFYYEDGQLRLEGKYKQGLKEGTWQSYDTLGNETLKIEYKRGVEVKIDGMRVKHKMEPLKINAVEQ